MWKPLPTALAALTLTATAGAQGTPLGFEERFALATDREAVLRELIPGTDDYYYFHCLHAQQTGALDDVAPLLRTWVERYNRNQRVVEIENRQMLLEMGRDPAKSLRALRERLGLRFDQQREVPGEKPDLPTALDPALLSPASLAQRAFQLHRHSVDGFTRHGLERLATSKLDDDQLMSLLGRLERPDVPNLPALVVRNLEHRSSRGFGSLPIHRRMLLEQLEECAQLRPKLLDDANFLGAWLVRLQPGADVQWRRDPAVHLAYLERLQSFVQRLSPANNSLKAHVLYHRLAFDLQQGRPDKDRFLAYLRLPRPGDYVRPEFLREGERRGEASDLSARYSTGYEPIGRDEDLVRAYLSHFFLTEDSTAAYDPYVRDAYLKRLFAETKILAGIGDMERWYSLLDDPAYYEALEQRVELEFPPTQRREYGPNDPVTLELDVKNVPTLLVKVFEIDALNYYRETGREVDASINLDGLVPNEQQTFTYDAVALRRMRRTFELPSLARPGVFVVDFIGNGRSSRAVVHKGRLAFLERTGAAGHVFQVLDDERQVLTDASVVFAGREYSADDRGEIVVPFSSDPGTRPLILRSGDRATLEQFGHSGESYDLDMGAVVVRETLLSGAQARVAVRPTLTLNGLRIDPALLDSSVLTITSRDLEGTTSTVEVRDAELTSDGELVHTLRVPEGLVELTLQLRGTIRGLVTNEDVELASDVSRYPLNAIDGTAETHCPLLSRSADGYALDVLGKNGEPWPDQAVHVSLTLRDYTDPLTVTLKTDERGRIRLGDLAGVTSVTVLDAPSGFGGWELRDEARTWPGLVQGVAGETLRVPFQGGAGPRAVSLLELRGGAYAHDRSDRARVNGGFVELSGLAPGDYSLFLRDEEVPIVVRLTAGEARGRWAIGEDRMLERAGTDELQITGITIEGGALVVRLANAGPDARVHLAATRYVSVFDLFARALAPAGPAPRAWDVEHPEATYNAGREIGDEYRYILERRLALKFPGNMLRRAGLLLNPWALEETDTDIGIGGGAGGRFGGRASKKARGGGPSSPGPMRQELAFAAGAFPNLDFLPEAARLLPDLRPDANGVVRIPLAELGQGHLVHALALDRGTTVYGTLARAETPLVPSDQRLRAALPADRHVVQERSITFVGAGEQVELETGSSTGAETYDSLASVYQLFATLSDDADLRRFAFVLRWPALSDEEKRDLYSRHACHELHVFLHEKDRAFFDAVVRPYLANKADRTFLDDWLLGTDLVQYLEPYAFARLNVVERILLTRRLEGQAESGVRLVREAWELLPPDTASEERAFRFALAGKALSNETRLGLELKSVTAVERMREAPGAEAAPAMEALKELGYAADADEEEVADKLGEDDRRDAFARAQTRQLYRAPDPTRRYVESNYWHRRIHEHVYELVPVNAFWLDFAENRGRGAFASTHFVQATRNFTEMMLALSFLDLPFEAGEHQLESADGVLRLRAASPLLLAVERVTEATPAEDAGPLLVSQSFFRLDDRWRFDGNERREKRVTDEFVIGVAYGSQVVLTNPTSEPRALDVLLQIPAGAIPLQAGFRTRGRSVRLEAYSTTTLEYTFYFPAPGDFAAYPAHVGEDGHAVAHAEGQALHVVPVATVVDQTSWDWISQNGTLQQVLGYLESANLGRVDLSRIAWRMRDLAAFQATVGHLRGRHRYDPTLWSFGLLHGDVAAVRDYLPTREDFVQGCGRYLESPVLTIDPVERRAWEIVEYEPLINARAHRFGPEYRILNGDLAQQYLQLLYVLCQKPSLDDDDWMTVTYYLLLQDRVAEALESFGRVDRAALRTGLQYDYMQAYLDFYTPDHRLARSIAERYVDHPVTRWRTMFRDVLDQLDEAEGRVDGPGRGGAQQQDALAATEPSLELSVEARRVTLGYENLARCTVSYYQMDLEFLFSASPFVQQGSGSFAYVRPNRRDVVDLPAGQNRMDFALPAEFRSSNVLVEVRAGGIVRRQAYYANTLAVQVIEGYGQVKVTDTASGRPLSGTYVKVFSRDTNGEVHFHKDGYTDLRGRFDYASISGTNPPSVDRFAILVLDEAAGATIQEAAPPAR